MERPDTCPSCGEAYELQPPDEYARMCFVGTTREYGGWEFYHI